MINQETLRKLMDMKMSGMADLYQLQNENKDFQGMDFDDRFNLLVDTEYDRRRSNKLDRLIKQATFDDSSAAVELIEYHADRKLDKQLILELASGTYLQKHHNIILMGASGNGKTWISNAFGIQACRQFYKVKYIRLPELLDELAVAKHEADGSFRKLIQKYRSIYLFIVDELLLSELTQDQVLHVLDIIDARLQRTSPIYCSQFSPEGWHSKLGQAQVADAILDRIVHDSYKILLDGDISMRERHSLVAPR